MLYFSAKTLQKSLKNLADLFVMVIHDVYRHDVADRTEQFPQHDVVGERPDPVHKHHLVLVLVAVVARHVLHPAPHVTLVAVVTAHARVEAVKKWVIKLERLFFV